VPPTYWSLRGQSHPWEPNLFRYISGSLMREMAVTKDLVFQRQFNSHRPHVSPYESFNFGVLRFDDKTKQAWRTNFQFPTRTWRRELSSTSLRICRSWGSQSLLTQDVTMLINCISDFSQNSHVSMTSTAPSTAFPYISLFCTLSLSVAAVTSALGLFTPARRGLLLKPDTSVHEG
jgi:hypothetical protein